MGVQEVHGDDSQQAVKLSGDYAVLSEIDSERNEHDRYDEDGPHGLDQTRCSQHCYQSPLGFLFHRSLPCKSQSVEVLSKILKAFLGAPAS